MSLSLPEIVEALPKRGLDWAITEICNSREFAVLRGWAFSCFYHKVEYLNRDDITDLWIRGQGKRINQVTIRIKGRCNIPSFLGHLNDTATFYPAETVSMDREELLFGLPLRGPISRLKTEIDDHISARIDLLSILAARQAQLEAQVDAVGERQWEGEEGLF